MKVPHTDSAHKKKKKLPEPHNDILPAGLALSKTEEVDPLHEELSDFIDRQQIAYLMAITERTMDNKFGQFLKENFEDNMSQCDGNTFTVNARSTRAEGAPPAELQRER